MRKNKLLLQRHYVRGSGITNIEGGEDSENGLGQQAISKLIHANSKQGTQSNHKNFVALMTLRRNYLITMAFSFI